MARQKGLIRIQGTLDEITFYKTPDGAGGIDKKRIATDPGFARTSENMQEFKTIAGASLRLRTALSALLKGPGSPASVQICSKKRGIGWPRLV